MTERQQMEFANVVEMQLLVPFFSSKDNSKLQKKRARRRMNQCNNEAPQKYNELIYKLKRNALIIYSEPDVLPGSKL
jgi:hypothetical protein